MKKVQKNQVNKNLLFFGIGFVCIIAVVGLVLNLSGSNATGAAINVEYYGASEKLMEKTGTLQTLVDLKPATLKTLSTPEGRLEIAKTINQKVDFKAGVLNIYKNAPYSTISAGSLNGVSLGAAKEETTFIQNLDCLKKIGANFRNRDGLKLALISELKYRECRNKLGWHYAYLEHSFFNQEVGGIMCRQEGSKLFAVEDKNGNVITDVSQC